MSIIDASDSEQLVLGECRTHQPQGLPRVGVVALLCGCVGSLIGIVIGSNVSNGKVTQADVSSLANLNYGGHTSRHHRQKDQPPSWMAAKSGDFGWQRKRRNQDWDKVIYIVRHGEKINTSGTIEAVDGEFVSADANSSSAAAMSNFETLQCLSQKGWARAYNMKSLFGLYPDLFWKPDAIFSANYMDPVDCRDRHGWYRTQQTISAVAQSFNITVDNQTGFMPQLCDAKVNATYLKSWPKQVQNYFMKLDLVSEYGTCSPYDRGSLTSNAGMCCNQAAADAILAKLADRGVNTILVAWESVNTMYLTRALGVPQSSVGPWIRGPFEYDRIYVLKYQASKLVSFETLYQGFGTPSNPWLGPESGCGAVAAAAK